MVGLGGGDRVESGDTPFAGALDCGAAFGETVPGFLRVRTRAVDWPGVPPLAVALFSESDTAKGHVNLASLGNLRATMPAGPEPNRLRLVGMHLIAVGLTVAAATAGCQSPVGCVAGAASPCACTNGLSGSQTCSSAGVYLDCVCSADSSSADAAVETVPAGPKRIFVTSLKYSAGALSGVCGDVANAAGLTGYWSPWLARGITGIHKSFEGGPWTGMDGTVLFKTKGQFATQPDAGILLDESGKAVPKLEDVWTGFKLGGSQGKNCLNFKDTTSAYTSETGQTGEIDGWTDGGFELCSGKARLYCIEM